MIQVRQVQKWQLAQNGKSADFTSSGLGSSAYTLINYPATLTQIIFIFFFAATADVYRNEGNEAFKKGDFINAIHFYTKGIKMNCNEKELKAKLYNNRAMAHFKLGKMMRALICIFFLFWSYWVVSSSFLRKVIICNASQKNIHLISIGLSNIKRSNLLPQMSVSIASFSQNYCNGVVVGLLHVWLIRDIYFDNRKSPGFTKGCRSSHWVKSNFP